MHTTAAAPRPREGEGRWRWSSIDPATSVGLVDALIEDITDVVAVTDHDLVITWVSPSVTTTLGYGRGDLVGHRFTDIVHPADIDAGLEGLAQASVVDGSAVDSVYRLRHADRVWQRFRLTAKVRLGPIAGIVLTATDVSARVAIEEDLAHSEQWAQALVDSSTDALLVLGGDGEVTYASSAVIDVFGCRPDELVGRHLVNEIHPDDLEAAQGAFSNGGRSPVPGVHRFRSLHRDGRWRVLDVVFTSLLHNAAVQGVLCTVRDVTPRLAAEDQLAEQADLIEAISRGASLGITLQRITQMVEHVIEGAHCAIGALEDDGNIRCHAAPNLAPAVVTFLDELTPESGPGTLLRSAAAATRYDLDALEGSLGDLFQSRGYHVCHVAPVTSSGDGALLGSIEVFHTSRRELSAQETEVLQRASDLSAIAIERQRLEHLVERQASYDPLTNLANRALFNRRADDALHRARRVGGGVAVLLVDLDRFKVINDSMGHEHGDRLLVEVARRFERTLRPGDVLARPGGDEFMVLCSRAGDAGAATAVAERLLAELEAPFVLDGGDVFVTASIGIAQSSEPSATVESIISAADVAMYRAKDQGRNQLVVFEREHDERTMGRLALEQAIRTGIENEEFELHYQPVVELRTGAMTHVEALVRWNRPGHGRVFPDVFIPVAEDSGLIVPLGWWILEDACRAAMAWPELPGGHLVQIAVNLSARQLMSPALIPTVTRVLRDSGLDPGRLCFEITESALVTDVGQAIEALNAIKELGVQVAIDDFGTGYASLEYVRHFTMADYLKIDRAFVDGVDVPGSHEYAIVSAATALARSVGLEVIAEGVETEAQMRALQDLDCELAQGYLFSRPIPLSEAIDLLARPSAGARRGSSVPREAACPS